MRAPTPLGFFVCLLSMIALVGTSCRFVDSAAAKPDLVSLAIRPGAKSIASGDRMRLMLVARYADGSTSDLTGKARWRVSAPRAVHLERPGVIRASAHGKATVTATLSGQQVSTRVTVGGRSMGPLRTSKVNPRYFVDRSGRIVYLAGSHTWDVLVDSGATRPPPRFHYASFLDFLQMHDHRVFRLWAWEQAAAFEPIPGPFFLSPSAYRRTGPGRAFDGGPRFDLTKFDPTYFARLRQRVVAARERGIYVIVMLFNGWSVERKGSGPGRNPWLGHPFRRQNNINGIDGDTRGNGGGEETHMLVDPRVTKLQERYVTRVVQAVGDQPNVLYEVSNESPRGSLRWQDHIVSFIRARERGARRHPVGITVEYPGGSNARILASSADWVSPNGDVSNPEAGSGQKVVLADTDHLCGICSDLSFPWKAFTRGLNPMLMDPYDGRLVGLARLSVDVHDTRWSAIRRRLGATQGLSRRLDLERVAPENGLASTGYCLCDARDGRLYVVYVPEGGSVTVDVSASRSSLRVEWVGPDTGAAMAGGRLAGHGRRTLAAPGSGDAVLVLSR